VRHSPQGKSFRYLELAYEWYSALRCQGLDIDIVGPDAPLDGYSAVFVPTMPIIPDDFIERISALDCPVLLGPRTGSKSESFCIPDQLPPGKLKEIIPITVTRVESLREGVREDGDGWTVSRWREDISSELEPELALSDGRGIVYRAGDIRYCGAWADAQLLDTLIARICDEAGLDRLSLPEGLRIRRSATHFFAFNYSTDVIDTSTLTLGEPVVGETRVPPAGVSIWAIA